MPVKSPGTDGINQCGKWQAECGIMPVPDILPVESLGTDGINQCGRQCAEECRCPLKQCRCKLPVPDIMPVKSLYTQMGPTSVAGTVRGLMPVPAKTMPVYYCRCPI